ncbi:MAG: LapA family protein [Firmicutes bacterium]|nr:LapA family protein [Bacillota bacterium]
MQIYFLIALVIALVIAILAVQNPSVVSLRFLFWEMPNTSLVMLILGSALGGGIAVLAFDLVRFWKMGTRLKQYAHENQRLKEQLEKAGRSPGEESRAGKASL